MPRYELSSIPWMGEPQPPFAIVLTDQNDVPLSIERHPSTDADGQQMADELISNFTVNPEGFQLGRLAVSYGGLQEIDEAGVPVVDPHIGSDIRLYVAEAQTGLPQQTGLYLPSGLPLIFLAAASLEARAVGAVPLANTPALIELANRFERAGRVPCGQVAHEQSLELKELDRSALVSLVSWLPVEHPVFQLAKRVHSSQFPGRRIARRG